MTRNKMTKRKYISYVRVSTQKQGCSGLGLDAQRAAVMIISMVVIGRSCVRSSRLSPAHAVIDPGLTEALRLCKRHKAVLVIAKLDRLARNVHFISGLMESGVEFVAVDMPAANRFVVHILAAVAEQGDCYDLEAH